MANWYVRPVASGAGLDVGMDAGGMDVGMDGTAGATYGDEDGTSYANAWNGFANITWGVGGVVAGDTLWLDGSATYYESMDIGASGSSGNVITIRGDYGGGQATISGGKQLSQTEVDWTYTGAQAKWACARFADQTSTASGYYAAVVDGAAVENSNSSNFSLYPGQQSNANFKEDLFVSDDPWNSTIYVAVRNYCMLIESHDYIDVSNIIFETANGLVSEEQGNLDIKTAENINITDCVFRYGGNYGCRVKTSDYVAIQDCIVNDNYIVGIYYTESSTYGTISGCTIYTNGLWKAVQRTGDTGGLLAGLSGVGSNFTVAGNEVYNNGRETPRQSIEGLEPTGALAWSVYSGDIYQKDLSALLVWTSTYPVAYLGIDNSSKTEAANRDSCDATTPWFFDTVTDILYLYFATDPADYTGDIEIAWANGADPGISLWNINDSSITGNNVHDNYSSGIGFGPSESFNAIVSNNTVVDNVQNTSRLHSTIRYGISVQGTGGFTVEGNTISGNGTEDTYGIRAFIASAGSAVAISRNTVAAPTGAASHGIWVRGRSNTEVYRNDVEGGNYGITATLNGLFNSNRVHGSLTRSISIETTATGVEVISNVCSGATRGLVSVSTAADSDVRNNIFVGTTIYGVFTQVGETEDYNCIYKTSGSDSNRALGSNTLLLDPQLDSNYRAGNDLLFGAGIAVAGVTTDYDGNAYSDPPTIGAFEMVGLLDNFLHTGFLQNVGRMMG